MAIANNRTKTQNIASLVTKDYITVIDKTKDTPPNTEKKFKPISTTSKISNKIGKRNAFATTKSPDPGNEAKGASIFPRTTSSDSILKKQDDRSLHSPSVPDGSSVTQNSIAYNSTFAHVTDGLPESTIVAIESMLNSQIDANSKITPTLTRINKNAHLLRGVASVHKALSEAGTSLKEKQNFLSLLRCKDLSGLNGNESNMINNIIVAGLLSQSLCMSKSKFLGVITDLVASKTHINGSILRGVVSAYSTNNNKTAAEKASLLASAASILPPTTATDTAMSSSKTSLFMSSIANENDTTTSPITEMNNIIGAASALDPNWNKDSNGGTNISRYRDNKYLATVSRKHLRSTATNPATLTSDPPALPVSDPNFLAKIMTAAASGNMSVRSSKDIVTLDYKG